MQRHQILPKENKSKLTFRSRTIPHQQNDNSSRPRSQRLAKDDTNRQHTMTIHNPHFQDKVKE